MTGEPNVVRTPAVLLRSLIAVGTPSSGGSSPPARSRRSAAAAAARARSGVTVMNAPSPASRASIRARRVLDQLGGAHLAAPGRRRPARARSGRAAGSRAARLVRPTHARPRYDTAAWTSPVPPPRPSTPPTRWPASARASPAPTTTAPTGCSTWTATRSAGCRWPPPPRWPGVVEQEWARGWSAPGRLDRRGHPPRRPARPPACWAPGPGEVLVGDSTSVNLYKLLVAGADARPGPRRAGLHRRRLPHRPVRRRRGGRGPRA